MGEMYPFYNEKTESEKRDWIQYGREIRKDMEERHEDPYKGHVIKAGTYCYTLPNELPQKVEEQSYEDKVNELLTELNDQIQNSADTVIADQKEKASRAKQLFVNPQNSVDGLVTNQNNINRANEIVNQSSVQSFARKAMNDRDEER